MISSRARAMDASGIRKVFDLARKIKDPINLSIGQPDFDVPEPLKSAACDAIRSGLNKYTPSAGMPELRKAARDLLCGRGVGAEDVMVTSGTSGGLTVSFLALLDPGDEVLIPDPYFVSYKQLAHLCGAVAVEYDTYPDFRPRLETLERVATDRARVLVVNSPANPTGVVYAEDEIKALADFARERELVVVSDEVYSLFSYDRPHGSIGRHYEKTVVLDGFSKSCAMTGWRVGFAAGPGEIINEMIKLQQFTFVCAPAPAQKAALTALSSGIAPRDDYARKRDMVVELLGGAFEFVRPEGAFYAFIPAPGGKGEEFCKRALEERVLLIPGEVFSSRDTHFRLSFAAGDEKLREGCRILARLACRKEDKRS